jgi:Mor family transcriptional regulator
MDRLKDITIDDMPNEDMRLVAETCGLSVAVKLLRTCGGAKLYVPKLSSKRLIDRKIVEEFNGGNVRRLRSRYGVSKRYIYNVLRKHRLDQRRAARRPTEGGFSMEHSVPA